MLPVLLSILAIIILCDINYSNSTLTFMNNRCKESNAFSPSYLSHTAPCNRMAGLLWLVETGEPE